MNFTVTVHAESLIAKMTGAPDELRRRLKIAVDRLSIQVQSAVKFNKLSGQVLHVRTNALRGRIGRGVEDRADGVFTQIWISESTPYGKAWEHGFMRKIGAGARGGAKSLRGMARERYMAKRPPGTTWYV